MFRCTYIHGTRDVKLLQNKQPPPFSVIREALTSHWYNMSHNFNKWHCYKLIWAKPTAKIQVSRNTDGSIQTIFFWKWNEPRPAMQRLSFPFLDWTKPRTHQSASREHKNPEEVTSTMWSWEQIQGEEVLGNIVASLCGSVGTFHHVWVRAVSNDSSHGHTESQDSPTMKTNS